jgi:hypothetical protein
MPTDREHETRDPVVEERVADPARRFPRQRPSPGAGAGAVSTSRHEGGWVTASRSGRIRVERTRRIRLAAAGPRHDVRPLGHLVLEPPDVGVLRRQLDRLGRVRTIPIASSVSRIAASRGSISSEKIEVRLDCIWGTVFDLRT